MLDIFYLFPEHAIETDVFKMSASCSALSLLDYNEAWI